jgi:starch phosphorylase
MQRDRPVAGVSEVFVYRAAVSAARPAEHYTARLLPACEGVALPLEDPRISWQH